MEDQRLSHMYARLIMETLSKRRERTWTWVRTNRSSWLSLLAILAFIIFAIGYVAHLHGRFRRLKTELKAMRAAPVDKPPMPGGQQPIVLQRTQLAEGSTPEFLSATLLPGRGLNVLQIMLSVPGRGPIPLLAAPSLEEATERMSGTGNDAGGSASLEVGAPIEAPWAGFISGVPGDPSPNVVANWHGRVLVLPATGRFEDTPISEGGLLLRGEADSVKHNIMPDGGTVQGSFIASNFGQKWPSDTSVSVTALLSSRVFDLRLVARNEGKEAVPVGLGWRPRFVFPGGSRTGVRLRLPAISHEEMRAGRATGHLPAVSGTTLDFTDRAGRLLRDLDLDDTFVDLKSGFLDNGPVLEIRDPRSQVGIRMTALSPQMRAIHVRSASDENTMTVGFQTNLDDPFSHLWSKDETAGIAVLQPGQSLQWHIRLEVFALTASAATEM